MSPRPLVVPGYPSFPQFMIPVLVQCGPFALGLGVCLLSKYFCTLGSRMQLIMPFFPFNPQPNSMLKSGTPAWFCCHQCLSFSVQVSYKLEASGPAILKGYRPQQHSHHHAPGQHQRNTRGIKLFNRERNQVLNFLCSILAMKLLFPETQIKLPECTMATAFKIFQSQFSFRSFIIIDIHFIFTNSPALLRKSETASALPH